MSATPLSAWEIVGFVGQAVFTGRMVVQWIASEREGDSVTPPAFWYMSIVGSALLLAYAISRADRVIILGQMFGVVVYSRNLALLAKKRRQLDAALAAAAVPVPLPSEPRQAA